MPYIDDLVDALLGQAGKTGDGPKSAARQAIMGAIETVNEEVDNLVVRETDTGTSVSIGAYLLELNKNIETIELIGKWDSATKRIIWPFTEITESEFVDAYAGQSFINQDVDERVWFPVEVTTKKKTVIRIHPAPTTAFTLGVVYFERVTSDNADQMNSSELFLSGARSSLGNWFPYTAALNYRQFKDHIERLKDARTSVNRVMPKHQRAQIAVSNAVATHLVT